MVSIVLLNVPDFNPSTLATSDIQRPAATQPPSCRRPDQPCPSRLFSDDKRLSYPTSLPIPALHLPILLLLLPTLPCYLQRLEFSRPPTRVEPLSRATIPYFCSWKINWWGISWQVETGKRGGEKKGRGWKRNCCFSYQGQNRIGD